MNKKGTNGWVRLIDRPSYYAFHWQCGSSNRVFSSRKSCNGDGELLCLFSCGSHSTNTYSWTGYSS